MGELLEDPSFNPEPLVCQPSSVDTTLISQGGLTPPWFSTMWFKYNSPHLSVPGMDPDLA